MDFVIYLVCMPVGWIVGFCAVSAVLRLKGHPWSQVIP